MIAESLAAAASRPSASFSAVRAPWYVIEPGAVAFAIPILGLAFQRGQGHINAAIARHTPAVLGALRPARAFSS